MNNSSLLSKKERKESDNQTTSTTLYYDNEMANQLLSRKLSDPSVQQELMNFSSNWAESDQTGDF
jgi:hypothetical protein